MSGYYKPVSPVVPCAGANDHSPLDSNFQKQLRGAAAGILHQHDARHSVFFGRPAIDVARIRPAQQEFVHVGQ
jgi:hypothetical protein